MSLITPLALAGLLFLPAVLAMYLLKLRRDPTVVPSTLLWQRLVTDVEANAPWQRLRRSLLLLLQLLLVAILVLLAARPFAERPAGLARDIVLVVDTSASMQATDVSPNRLEAAKAAAIYALRDLPSGGKVSVIAAGRTARVVANGSDDIGHVKQAIEGIEPTADVGDLGDALRLASALAARSGDAEIVVATDAALATPPSGSLDAPVRVLRVGRAAANQAIVALAVSTGPSGLSHSAFISVANTGLEMARRRIELYADGNLREARTLTLDPQRRTDVSIDDIDDAAHPASVVEVRLVAADATAADQGAAPDALALDDRAWAIVPPTRPRDILLVGNGDPYLETALSYLPDTNLFGTTPERYAADVVRPDGTSWDLIILEGFLPDQLPATPVLAIAPPSDSPLGAVTGTLTDPAIGTIDPSDPILRYVDLSTTHIAQAQRLALPDWARAVIPGVAPGSGSSPLLYAGQLDGRPAAVMAFEPRRSDLPLQVAFPVLMANLAGELMGGSGTPIASLTPGTPVTLPIPAGAAGVRVTRPDGSVDELVAPTGNAASVTFARTDLLGVYTVTPLADPEANASGGASGEPASPATTAMPDRFAVDLLDVDESSIAPGDSASIEALGRTTANDDGTGAAATDRPPARDELWVPILLVALIVLTAEWLVYERDTVARLWRGLGARLGRRGSPERGA